MTTHKLSQHLKKLIPTFPFAVASFLSGVSLQYWLLTDSQSGLMLLIAFYSWLATLHFTKNRSLTANHKALCLSTALLFASAGAHLLYSSALNSSIIFLAYSSMLIAASFSIYFFTIYKRQLTKTK